MKTKMNKQKLKDYLLVLLINAIAWSALCYVAVPIGREFFRQPVKTIHLIKEAKAQISLPEDEPTEMKAWIKWRISQTNISWKDYDCMVRHESNYNQYAINKNTNGTYDIGYLQINELHNLPREVAFDYKQATEWAINKIKHDGNMTAWYGYVNNCR